MKRFLILTIVLFAFLTISFASSYEVTAEASGVNYSQAQDKALGNALSSLSKMIYVKVSEEVEQSVYQSTGKKREETYKKQLKLRTKLILEGYEVQILRKWKKGKDYWVTLKVSIPLEKVRLVLKDAVTIENAYNLYESGFLTAAEKVLVENELFLDQIAGYSMEKDKLKLLIEKKKAELEKLYDNAVKDYKEGKIKAILDAYAIISKEWKDFPYIEDIEKILSEMQNNLKVKVSFDPDYLLINSTTRVFVTVLYKNSLLDDGSKISLKTPDKTIEVNAEGEKIYFDIIPSFITPRYCVDIYISGYKIKSVVKPVRVLPEYDSLKQCNLEVSKESYSMLKVNEKVMVELRTLPGVWIYIFDYKEMTGTMKEILSMRMTGDGQLAFPISFDSPSDKFYEGMIVIFSKEKLLNISEGIVYTVDEVRDPLSARDNICEKEVLYIISK